MICFYTESKMEKTVNNTYKIMIMYTLFILEAIYMFGWEMLNSIVKTILFEIDTVNLKIKGLSKWKKKRLAG